MSTERTTIKQLSDGNAAGTLLGQSTSDKLGFYGLATPIVQPSGSGQAAVTITAVTAVATTATITTAAHGFATGTHGDAVVKRVAQLRTDMVAMGTLVNKLRTDLVALKLIAGA